PHTTAPPLLGAAVFQFPSSKTGGVAVTPGILLMSAAVSDKMMRRLALVKSRSLYRIEVTSSGVPVQGAGAPPMQGRRMRSTLVPPIPVAVSGRLSRFAPVAV